MKLKMSYWEWLVAGEGTHFWSWGEGFSRNERGGGSLQL